VSAANCWALGQFGHGTGSGLMLNQVLDRNGAKEPKGGNLTNEILRWNGKKWSVWS
jgi:hypothetical protein